MSGQKSLKLLHMYPNVLAKTGNPDMVWWSFPIAEIMSLSASIFFMIKIHREVIRHIPDNE
jgi:hypothetical protein